MRAQARTETRLGEIAGLFLKLGTIAFGGPAAHIAMMQDEVVRRRGWLSQEEFLDLLGATNLIPGPNSTEMAIHIGHRRAGWPGLIVAGVCFILPAAIIVSVIAAFYVRYGTRPQAEALLYGIKPVIIAVILQALWALARTAAKNLALALLAVAAFVLNLIGVHELAVLAGAGLIAAAPAVIASASKARCILFPIVFAQSAAPLAAAAAPVPFSLGAMFFFFLKVGSIRFGSGYVFVAFLQSDLVERWGWLTEQQLLDAVAVGQFTPGPVFTTATFIGWILAGWRGGVLATAGIFLPAFFFVAISGPLVPRLRRWAIAGKFLDGINVASLALMAVVTLHLSRAALTDWFTVLIFALAALLLLKWRVNSIWLILGGGAAGMAWRLIH